MHATPYVAMSLSACMNSKVYGPSNGGLVRVELTGERDSEIAPARAQPTEPGTLYINDLGYASHDYLADIDSAEAHLLTRLEDNADPIVVAVHHGVHAPVGTVRERVGLRQASFTKSHDTFDLDAELMASHSSVVLRVVGCYDPETDKVHRYVTTLARAVRARRAGGAVLPEGPRIDRRASPAPWCHQPLDGGHCRTVACATAAVPVVW